MIVKISKSTCTCTVHVQRCNKVTNTSIDLGIDIFSNYARYSILYESTTTCVTLHKKHSVRVQYCTVALPLTVQYVKFTVLQQYCTVLYSTVRRALHAALYTCLALKNTCLVTSKVSTVFFTGQ